jgi:hypothetical protein
LIHLPSVFNQLKLAAFDVLAKIGLYRWTTSRDEESGYQR